MLPGARPVPYCRALGVARRLAHRLSSQVRAAVRRSARRACPHLARPGDGQPLAVRELRTALACELADILLTRDILPKGQVRLTGMTSDNPYLDRAFQRFARPLGVRWCALGSSTEFLTRC